MLNAVVWCDNRAGVTGIPEIPFTESVIIDTVLDSISETGSDLFQGTNDLGHLRWISRGAIGDRKTPDELGAERNWLKNCPTIRSVAECSPVTKMSG
jgi:hypothetical protein